MAHAILEPENGLERNPLTGYFLRDHGGMGKQSLTEIIHANIATLRRKAGAGKKMGAKRFAAFVGIGEGTIWRIDQMSGGTNVETLEAIAAKFGLQAWQLLIPNCDPSNPPMLIPVSPSERLLWDALEAARKEPRDVVGTETGTFTARKAVAASRKRT